MFKLAEQWKNTSDISEKQRIAKLAREVGTEAAAIVRASWSAKGEKRDLEWVSVAGLHRDFNFPCAGLGCGKNGVAH